ncbi:hypothetical protein NDU88_003210 [Pleurodeles waltl]|uniref:Uncharacterized protein n=1 Tax=Pleurodeles waltl TaxID=8319 RepID=A0AAV7LHZ0_PLEWA|nr:hypothetical protein NDU88_003210 [Pleurodeles waltl]
MTPSKPFRESQGQVVEQEEEDIDMPSANKGKRVSKWGRGWAGQDGSRLTHRLLRGLLISSKNKPHSGVPCIGGHWNREQSEDGIPVRRDPSGGELWSVSAWAQGETGARGSSADLSCDAAELRGSGAGYGAPIDGGRRRIAPGGGAEGAVGPYEPWERCYPLTERWRWSALGLRDQDFSPERKSGGPPTPQALLTLTSAGVRRVGYPGRAPYESDFTVRPRLSNKLRTADGAHQRDTGEDIRLSAKIIGAQWTMREKLEPGARVPISPVTPRS